MDEQVRNNSKHMISSIMIMFGIIFLLIGIKFLSISITKRVNGVDLVQYGNTHMTQSLSLNARRGTIYDRYGNVIATNVNLYVIYAVLEKIEDKDLTAATLSEVTGCDKDFFLEKLNKQNRYQVEFGNCGKINTIQKEQIIESGLPGLGFTSFDKRHYPEGEFSSHTIGFTESGEGVMGIEEYYNQYLRGEDGQLFYKNDSAGYHIFNQYVSGKDVTHGADVYLTIDSELQLFLQNKVDDVYAHFMPEEIIAVVMDAETGEILALDNRPTFNLNEKDDVLNYYNTIISKPFEPGSTMKPYTYAAAIDLGVYNGQDTYQSGSITIPGGTIHDWNWNKDTETGGWGTITYDYGLYNSSNVAITKILTELITVDDLLNYQDKFGFGKVTGIELPSEQAGFLASDKFSKITSGFGQGMYTTPIQHLQAFSAFLNNGYMVKPTLINKVVSQEDEFLFKELPKYVIKEETAAKMKELLIGVVENGPNKYKVENVTIAGKTGTAQIWDETFNKYLEDEYYYSFIGASNPDNPDYIMYVAVKKPLDVDEELGGEPNNYVAYIFKEVMTKALELKEIRQTETVFNLSMEVEDFIGNSVNLAKIRFNSLDLIPVILGNQNVITGQYPLARAIISSGNRVFIKTSGDIVMPDMSGWSYKDVLYFSKLSGLKLKSEGYGFVTSQSIKENNIIINGEELYITFGN